MLIVIMCSGREVNPDAYIIAASIFGVAGAITTAANIFKNDRNKKEE